MIDILLEIFTWIGFGAGFLLLVATIAAWAVDGTWLPADAFLEDEPEGRVARWIDAAGDVNRAVLTDDQAPQYAGRDRAEIWYRLGSRDRMRSTRRATSLRPLVVATACAFGLGIVASAVSLVLLFTG